MEKSIITTKGLGLQIGSRYILKDINWEIEEKSRWIIIGMNGSGKTTLLSILSGYQAFNHGELLYKNKQYSKYDVFELRKSMGWISNSFFDQVYKNESVLDIMLASVNGTYGIEETDNLEEWVKKIKELLPIVNLADRLDSPFGWLSKGEKQSVLIARTLLTNPEVLVFDEPMTGLDVLAREMIRRFVEVIVGKKEHTMIYVTHHFDEISPLLFDKCMLLKNGRIYHQGNIEEIFKSQVMSDFLGIAVNVKLNDDGYYSLTFDGRPGEKR